jgi:UDP-N-acetylglucosamine--N-acetylmuramyl-(pentapeptide) pyrophosphoryl-undecaprenol N-acetylglucosamine transferase
MKQGCIMIMAGGTGGHVFPGLALARALQQRHTAVEWLGSLQSFESKLIPEKSLVFNGVAISGFRGKGVIALLLAPFRILRACWQAIAILRKTDTTAAISFGGFAAGPGGLAAVLLGIPLFVHEQNSIAGLTNKVLAKFSKRVYCGFPEAIPGSKSSFVGNPVRQEISEIADPEIRFTNRSGRLRILCIGGSLGAKALNELLPQAIAQIPCEQRPIVRHQAGAKLLPECQALYQKLDLDDSNVSAFINDMAEAYSWADWVICRAGALTVAEIAAAGLGCLFVPYPFAVDDHQSANAQFLVRAGSADCIQQKDLSSQQLCDYLMALDRDQCLSRAKLARSVAKTNAASDIANDLTRELQGLPS